MIDNNNNKKKIFGLSQISNNTICNCCSEKRLDYCGCCDGIKTFTPADLENPPSLSFIRYRIGDHGMFKESMFANLSRKKKNNNNSVLSKLTTREDNDLAIAIIDAWATIADVITFYQERIANEGFLRTLTERMSVLELARSIGYELGPGMASDTFLAFNIEENNPTIEKSIIEIGTKVQSIPHQGEVPQTFETIERIEARPELNEIKANTKLTHIVNRSTNTLYFRGVDTKLRQDDRLLIINKNDKLNFKYFAKVLDVKADEKKDITITKIQIIWPPPPAISNTASTQNAGVTTNIGSRIEISHSSGSNIKQKNFSSGNDVIVTKEEEEEEEEDNVKVRIGSHILGNALSSSQIASMAIEKNVCEKELIEDQNKAVEENSKNLAPYVYVFRQKASIFGHDAQSYDAITLRENFLELDLKSDLTNWDLPELHIFEKVNIGKKPPPNPPGTDFFESYSSDPTKPIIFLDNLYENIISKNQDNENDSDNWIVFNSRPAPKMGIEDTGVLVCQVRSTIDETLVEYTVTGKVTGIELKTLSNEEQIALANFRRRNTTVFIQSERLELAEKIDESSVEKDFVELEKGIVGLRKNQIVIITGEILDETGKPTKKIGTEYRKLREVTTKTIFFDVELDNKYLRESVKIYANVVKATHGETKRDVLGSGDPTITQQSFTIKQKPLTYIKSSTTPTGASSTLEVRIDDILWKEVDYFYGTSPKDRVFISRKEDDGSTIITFGDGKRGSKPFIGLENITAKYRIGTGREGLLKQNQLSLLIDRPLGIKSVTNPFPTSASEDPENLESARTNAPLKVLTMDRIVSIADFENFARCFAGIGKAKASEIWNGNKIIVHLSIASSSGQKLDLLTLENITRSIEKFKDPHIPFILDSFIKKTFSLTAKIKINKDMLSDKVLLSVKNMILDTFSFENRQFGQSVTLSEIVTLIQNIPGVIFVDLDQLYFDNSPLTHNKPEKYLSCSSAYYDDKLKKIIPAEMLVVNPQGVKLLAVVD